MKNIEPEEVFKKRLIIHSDRGAQLTSNKYIKFTIEYQIIFNLSMSQFGCPKFNAIAERFIRTIKNVKLQDESSPFQNMSFQEILEKGMMTFGFIK